MEIIALNKLRDIYQSFARKNYQSLYKKRIKFNYLNLSIFFSRDIREFDINNYKLLNKLFLKDNINKTYSVSKKSKRISGYLKYILSLKEYSYLPSNKLPIIIAYDLLKFFQQFLDILGILLITFFIVLKNNLHLSNKKNWILKNQTIYSIYYWIEKNENSGTYYYPGINEKRNCKIFISSFADVKLISKGLLISACKTDYLTPGNILNISDLILSILQFIHLFFHDFNLVFLKKKSSFFFLWVGWKKAGEIFYSLLVYNSILKLSNKSIKSEFISWYENQITNRAFSLAVSYSKRIYSSSVKLSSFNGALITNSIPDYFLPTKIDYEIGFIGENYYVQDKSSEEELKNYLQLKKIDIAVKKVPSSMVRTKYLLEDKKSYTKSRSITIFTHATYWDLLACILSIFNEKNKNCNSQRIIVKKEKLIFIRLHPSLNERIALEEIKNIKEIPNYVRFEFINNKKETFIKSLNLSNYSYFGISTYVNLAIELNHKVIAVVTSHKNQPPIKKKLLNANNLEIADPW